jgi:hypothetical protein
VANDIIVDETLPNFIKQRHPRKGEIKGQGSMFGQTTEKRRAT